MKPHSGGLPRAFWREIFGNDHPVSVEIGPGRGDFLLAAARQHPDRNFFAIERSHSHTRRVQEKLSRSALPNARVLQGDAGCIVSLLPDECVQAYYALFPDPWWKRRHRRRRLWSKSFIAELTRTLVPGGTIEFVTDVEEYFRTTQDQLDDAGLEPSIVGSISEAPQTTFARKAVQRRDVIYRSVHRRRSGAG